MALLDSNSCSKPEMSGPLVYTVNKVIIKIANIALRIKYRMS